MQLLRYCLLRLAADIGEEVQTLWSQRRNVDATKRVAALATLLAQSGRLEGGLRVPNTAGDFQLVADIKAKQLTASIDIEAPQDRGARSRVTWLVNQLADAPAKTVIEAEDRRHHSIGRRPEGVAPSQVQLPASRSYAVYTQPQCWTVR